MLSDEEKKAIEYWKTHMEILHWNTQLASEHYIKVLLDLIEKQSKEIEEYKKQLDLDYVDKHFVTIERYNQLEKEIEELKRVDISNSQIIANMSTRHFNDREKIRKYEKLVDKIKEKIEEVKDGTYDAEIVLQSLLEKE